jgi:hypothetical protein
VYFLHRLAPRLTALKRSLERLVEGSENEDVRRDATAQRSLDVISVLHKVAKEPVVSATLEVVVGSGSDPAIDARFPREA